MGNGEPWKVSEQGKDVISLPKLQAHRCDTGWPLVSERHPGLAPSLRLQAESRRPQRLSRAAQGQEGAAQVDAELRTSSRNSKQEVRPSRII